LEDVHCLGWVSGALGGRLGWVSIVIRDSCCLGWVSLVIEDLCCLGWVGLTSGWNMHWAGVALGSYVY
jgi:hypothetical protein